MFIQCNKNFKHKLVIDIRIYTLRNLKLDGYKIRCKALIILIPILNYYKINLMVND